MPHMSYMLWFNLYIYFIILIFFMFILIYNIYILKKNLNSTIISYKNFFKMMW
uniref:ATP synthase F0 subunit 8 n=1 Tax=Chouioia cunea TaxID=1570515 RepID=A0A8B0R6S5_9HYME|nr:ATP synthase F0 subunit 8 [Chouioia cunea]QTW90614.1 ATP synthase F0 subunit 8 [Chouioia cunea]